MVVISLGSCYADDLAIYTLIGHPMRGMITVVLVAPGDSAGVDGLRMKDAERILQQGRALVHVIEVLDPIDGSPPLDRSTEWLSVGVSWRWLANAQAAERDWIGVKVLAAFEHAGAEE